MGELICFGAAIWYFLMPWVFSYSDKLLIECHGVAAIFFIGWLLLGAIRRKR